MKRILQRLILCIGAILAYPVFVISLMAIHFIKVTNKFILLFLEAWEIG